jgi:TatA/E family protein of Tat protein translocase
MFGIGPMELVVIVVVALLIFGPQKLPELARALGKGLAEFRRASNDLRQTLALDELQDDLRKTMNEASKPPPSRPAQAGDSLPPGPGTAGDSASPPWKGHPGELPEGGDHDHHAPSSADASVDASAKARDEASAANSVPAPGSASQAGASPTPDPQPRPADSGLGNVPVTRADPSDPDRG